MTGSSSILRSLGVVLLASATAACSGSSAGTTNGSACGAAAQSCSASSPCCAGLTCAAIGVCIAEGGNTVGTSGSAGNSSGSIAANTASSSGAGPSGPASGSSGAAITVSSGSSGTIATSGTIGGSSSATTNGSSGSTGCVDACTDGATQCASLETQQTCQQSSTGCLAWVTTSCPSGDVCSTDQCAPAPTCASCPPGYSCDANNVCTGGNPAGLVLNVPSVTVSGNITLNGAAPTLNAECSYDTTLTTGSVNFVETTYGYSFSFSSLCSDSTFGFSGTLYPGTYQVTVSGSGWSNLPTAGYVVQSALTINSSGSGLVLNVPSVTVNGNITLNGAAPSLNAECSYDTTLTTGSVDLIETTYGYSFSFSSLCSDSTFGFSGTLYPGTYKVTVSGSGWSNLPTAGYVVQSALAINSSAGGLVLNVPSVTVSGNITLNGAAPTLNAECSYDTTLTTGSVTFVETTYGYSFSFNSLCSDSTFGFSGTLYPGTYQVTVSGSGWSNLPTAGYVVQSALTINTSAGGLVLNVPSVTVSGNITLNGAVPTLNAECSYDTTLTTGSVTFVETTYGYSFSFSSLCSDSTFGFSGTLYPGTYKVIVSGSGWSNLPTAGYVVQSALTINTSGSGLVLNVPSVTVSGTITLNGAAPSLNAECSYDTTLTTGSVKFVETTYGYSFSFNSLCSDSTFGFSGTLYPGTYQVIVSGSGWSNLPTAGYVVQSALGINTSAGGLVLNVPSTTVSGSITLNGVAPSLNAECAYDTTLTTGSANFTETTYGYSFTFNTLCSDPTFGFSGTLYPGTYEISVSGSGWSTLPGSPYVVVAAVQIP